MPSSLSLRKRSKILPPLRFRLSGNIDSWKPSCSPDNVPEKKHEETTTSSSLNLPKCVSTRRNGSLCNLEPLPDGSKANIIAQTFDETNKLTFNRRKRAKQVSSARSVFPDNLELLPSGSTISAAKEFFDESTEPSFNFPKCSKHVSSQISESWCNSDPLLDGKKENASEKPFGGMFNFEKLPNSSKKTSAQAFDETTKTPAFNSRKHANSVSYKRIVSSENFEQLAGGSKDISPQTFNLTTKSSFNPRKLVKSTSSKKKISSDNLVPLPGGSKESACVSEKTFDDTAKSSFNSSKSAKYMPFQRNESSFDLESSFDVIKKDISEENFNKKKNISLCKARKRPKLVSSQKNVSSENNNKLSPCGSKGNITQQIFNVTTDASSNPRKRVKSLSSKRKVSSCNLVSIPSDSKESVCVETFDVIAKSTFNSFKSAKDMSSQKNESSFDLEPSLDVIKKDVSEEHFNKKKKISLSKVCKRKKLLPSQKSVSLNNFELLSHDSKKNASQQTFGITTESSSFNPRKHVNFVSKTVVSSDEFKPLPCSLKEIVSEQTFHETTKTSSSNLHKRVKSVSSKIKVSSDSLDQSLGYSKDGVSEQAFVGTTEPSFNDCKCAKHVSFQDSGISKSAVSEVIFGENFDLFTFKRCKCGDWLYKRSGSSDKFKPVLSDLKDLDSKQTFNDDATKLLNFHKRKLSQISGSLHNLDSLPAFSKTPISKQTLKKITDSSLCPRKHPKHVSSQNSSSPSNIGSLPSPSKSPVSEQTLKNNTDSSICPHKDLKHVLSEIGSLSSNLHSLPDSSKTPASKQTFKKITDSSICPREHPKHMSSQSSSSSSNLDSIPKTLFSKQTLRKITDSPISPCKRPKHVSSKNSSLSSNLDSIPGSSKTPISKQRLKKTADSSISPCKKPKHVSSQNSSSSSNLDSIPKTPISKKTFKKITDSSISSCKHPKHVSSQNSSSSGNLDSVPCSSKTPVTKQTLKKTADSSISPHKKPKHAASQNSSSSSNLDSIPKTPISKKTFKKITDSSINPCKHASSQNSSSSSNLDSIPGSSKTPVSKQRFKKTANSSISPCKKPKHASSQNSSSSSNLDSIPKTPISKKTFKKITDSSISSCKLPKHVSSQNSSSSGNLDSVPCSSKTPVTKQTLKKITDSSISPRKKFKHASSQISGLSNNLDTIPGSSKNTVSKLTLDGASKDNSSKGNELNQLAAISLNIINSKFRRFIRGEKNQQNICRIVTNCSNYVLKEILKAAIDYMKECGRSQFTAADFHRGITVCGLDLEDSEAEKKKKPVRKRKKLMPEGNTEKGPSEDKKSEGSTEKEPSEVQKPEGNTELKPSEDKKPEGNTELEPSKDKKPESIPVKSSFQNVYVNERWLRDPLSVSIEDLEEELQNYFKALVVILYYNMEEEGCVMSNNMQTNRNLTQLIPHFVDFFCKVIAEFENDFVKVSLVFKFIDSLLRNPYVYFGQDCYLNTLFCAFFKFLVADLKQSNQGSLDCWTLKNNVGNIVLLVLKKSKCQHLYFEGMSLVNTVLTSDYSLSSCYGALVFLKALGVPAILQLLPSYVEKFCAENQTVPCSNSDLLSVQEQIIRLYYILVNYYLKNEVMGLEFNLSRHVRSKFVFPDYLKDIKVLPVISNIEKTLSSYTGEILLPVKIRLLNFVFHSTNLGKRKIRKQEVSRKKKQRNKKLCFTNYPLLMETII